MIIFGAPSIFSESRFSDQEKSLTCFNQRVCNYHLVIYSSPWKIPTINGGSNRKIIYKWAIFHGYVSHNQRVFQADRCIQTFRRETRARESHVWSQRGMGKRPPDPLPKRIFPCILRQNNHRTCSSFPKP